MNEEVATKKVTDSGFTLIELIVYVSLFVVILTIVSSFLINSTTAQREVRSANEATTLGQLIAQSVQKGVRNASGISVTSKKDGELLVARTARGGGEDVAWSCQAWYFSASDGAVYTTTNSGAEIKVGKNGPKDWTFLGDGVAPSGSTILSSHGSTIDLDFLVDAGDRPGIHIQTSALQRMPGTEGEPCFKDPA